MACRPVPDEILERADRARADPNHPGWVVLEAVVRGDITTTGMGGARIDMALLLDLVRDHQIRRAGRYQRLCELMADETAESMTAEYHRRFNKPRAPRST